MPKTSKEIAILKYTFMFNPQGAWTRQSDFEADLAAFLRQQGMEAEIVRVMGNDGDRVVYLSPSQNKVLNTREQRRKTTNPGDRINQLRKK